jgi:K(+)-stimulated pyrophosphate-energized sodium pump
VRLGLPQSRISFINIFVIGASIVLPEFIYRSTTHILIVVAFIFGAFFSALAEI